MLIRGIYTSVELFIGEIQSTSSLEFVCYFNYLYRIISTGTQLVNVDDEFNLRSTTPGEQLKRSRQTFYMELLEL